MDAHDSLVAWHLAIRIPQPCLGLGSRSGGARAPGWPERIGADPREIVWTSGATGRTIWPSGAAHFYKGRQKHLITVKTEHKAVLDVMRELERQG